MSVCCTQVDSLLVPYFFISPPIRWRGVDVAVDGLLLLTTSLFLLDFLPIVSERVIPGHLLALANANKEAHVTLHTPALLYHSLNHGISRLDSRLNEHEKSIEELAAHAQHNVPDLKEDPIQKESSQTKLEYLFFLTDISPF